MKIYTRSGLRMSSTTEDSIQGLKPVMKLHNHSHRIFSFDDRATLSRQPLLVTLGRVSRFSQEGTDCETAHDVVLCSHVMLGRGVSCSLAWRFEGSESCIMPADIPGLKPDRQTRSNEQPRRASCHSVLLRLT